MITTIEERLNFEDALYQAQIDFVQKIPLDLYDLEKELCRYPEEEQEALADYFFLGKKVDVTDIFEYRENLLIKDNLLPEIATKALKRLINNFRLEKEALEIF